MTNQIIEGENRVFSESITKESNMIFKQKRVISFSGENFRRTLFFGFSGGDRFLVAHVCPIFFFFLLKDHVWFESTCMVGRVPPHFETMV